MALEEIWARKAKARRDKVLSAALLDAQAHGYRNITRERVAALAGVSLGSVNQAFGDMASLKTAVMVEAVNMSLLDIIAQGLADKHETALNAPPSLKESALATLT